MNQTSDYRVIFQQSKKKKDETTNLTSGLALLLLLSADPLLLGPLSATLLLQDSSKYIVSALYSTQLNPTQIIDEKIATALLFLYEATAR